MLQWLRPSELTACFLARLKQVAPERAYVNVDFYCDDAVQKLPICDGLTREQPKDSGVHCFSDAVFTAQDLTKHIAEYQRKLKASRDAMGIAFISLDVTEKIAAAKPKGKKKKQAGKQGYANAERHIRNGGGTGGIAYVDCEDTYYDYDDFM
ncbi:hypothetical protein PsorP6_014192 [Peronosclerospora sorghi]|uniref:Uncharacterized protein n=1 Tax=Peronosclerospora sorghi TaxID=230839 RepID=A0ACC0VFM4_9STRA|nr:hypothetical protein PsorP6_014192 [Peronosclerospora sorghi]